MKKAIDQLSKGKAPGADSIPTAIYKEGGDEVIRRLLQLYVRIWEDGEVPQDALIVHIYKRKGDRACCDKHRGITLLSIDSWQRAWSCYPEPSVILRLWAEHYT